jgi:hypothetical protein
MIIVFANDQTVGVFHNIDSVLTACEAVDVEDGEYCFFDECGRRFVPIIIKPVSRTPGFFGEWVSGGDFKLELDTQDDGSAFDRAIATVLAIDPNPRFASVADLARHVSDNRRQRTSLS